MPVERFAVEGFDAFREKLAEVEKKGKIVIVLFSGSKTKGGKSWCPDCEDAFPVVNHVLDEVEDQVVFLYVGVGGRDFWKDPNCVFRYPTNVGTARGTLSVATLIYHLYSVSMLGQVLE